MSDDDVAVRGAMHDDGWLNDSSSSVGITTVHCYRMLRYATLVLALQHRVQYGYRLLFITTVPAVRVFMCVRYGSTGWPAVGSTGGGIPGIPGIRRVFFMCARCQTYHLSSSISSGASTGRAKCRRSIAR